MGFNPRPCARGDLIGASTIPVVRCFNPRPCTRGDRRLGRIKKEETCFNPRPCARGDISELKTLIHPRVSIYAPARGATFSCDSVFLYDTGFNPRPCARGDTVKQDTTSWDWRFNPRPCARGDKVIP